MSRGTVCFTGAGDRISGEKYTRQQWGFLAQQFNYSIVSKVDWHTTYLVASRTDTKKASAARDLGVQVTTYADFERMVLAGQTPPARRNSEIESDGHPRNNPTKDTTLSIYRHGCLFRVIRADTRDLIGDYDTLSEAREAAAARGGVMQRSYGYDVKVIEEDGMEPPVDNAVDAERVARAIQWED